MMSRSTPETLLLLVGGALVVLAFLFGFATIFVPEFRQDGAAIVTIIFGALGSAMTALLAGAFFRREIGGAVDQEDKVQKEARSKRNGAGEEGEE